MKTSVEIDVKLEQRAQERVKEHERYIKILEFYTNFLKNRYHFHMYFNNEREGWYAYLDFFQKDEWRFFELKMPEECLTQAGFFESEFMTEFEQFVTHALDHPEEGELQKARA